MLRSEFVTLSEEFGGKQQNQLWLTYKEILDG